MADMKEPLKKLLFTVVGAATVTAEKANELIDEFVKKGEITVEDGKKLAKEMQEKADVAEKEYSKKIKTQVESTMSKLGYVKKSEVDDLKKELEELKAQMGGAAKPKKAAAKKETVKKATPKKKTEK